MRPRPAFTLTEILAATAILSVMFTIMFGILQQTSRGWQAANRRVEASQAARLALEQIASDLENCVAFVATNVAVAPAEPTNRSYAFGFRHLNGSEGAGSSWYPAEVRPSAPNDTIFIATPRPGSVNSAGTDLAVVGYAPLFVSRPGGYNNTPEGRYVLCRSFPMSNGIPLHSFAATNWNTLYGIGQGGSIVVPNFLPIVDNCLRFEIQFVYNTTNNLTRTNATWGWTDTNSNTGWRDLPPGARPGLPWAADITLAVLDDRTAERLYRLPGAGRTVLPPETLEKIPTNLATISPINVQRTLQEGLTWFHRRVYFKNHAAYVP